MLNQILELYKSSEVDRCLIANFKSDWQDVKQDVFERLLKMRPEQIESIKNIRHYLLRIIINIKRQPYDPSAKLYRKNEKLTDIPELICDQYCEDDFIKQIEKVEKLDWYNKGILELYAELGSVRAVAEKTKIPFYSVKYTIKETRKICRQEY